MTRHYSFAAASVLRLAVAAMFIGVWANCCRAEEVTDWRTYKASPATILAGQGTNDPVLGAIGTTSQASFLIGYFTTPAVLGPNVGDIVTLTFGVSFNDAVGTQGVGDNFRFALFDLNGESQDSATGGASSGPNYATQGTTNTDNFRGYWFGNKGGGGAGDNGSIRERNVALTGSLNPFTNNATDPAPSLGAVGGVNVPLIPDVNGNNAGGDFVGEMTLTRAAGGFVNLSGKLKNSSNVGNEFSASDTTLNATSTYGAVAFLNGNGLSFDQASFVDVNVTVGSANITGDYNLDGVVDSADYVMWRKQNPAGTNTDVGYTDWKAHFAEGNAGSGGVQVGSTSVPEPAFVPLAGIAVLVAVGFMRRRPQLARVSC